MTIIQLIRDNISDLILSKNMYNNDLFLYQEQWDTTHSHYYCVDKKGPPHEQ